MTKNNQTKRGYGSYCKACHTSRARAKATYAGDRDHYLRYRYGITLADYEAMYAAQDGKCAICHGEQWTFLRGRKRQPYSTLYVDHDHATGKVRALLCHGCNTAVGLLRENHERARGLIAYLKKHQIA
jgi:hypothetical protein